MSDFVMLAQKLAQLVVRREELNEEWDEVQGEISQVIAALRGTLVVVPVPDHVRLRRAQVSDLGMSPIVPCPQPPQCGESLGEHLHTADGKVHPRSALSAGL